MLSTSAESVAALPSAPVPTQFTEPSNVDRVRRALALVEEAQSLLRYAASELSSVPWFVDEYGHICRLEENVHKHWNDLSSSLSRKRSKLV
ncbi:MAG: hypothetical protein K8U03_09110 [Planctomycetia bacterium]|nr:hypothetical protein [Planctomycetia bacterium]